MVNSSAKGKRGELEAASVLDDLLGGTWERLYGQQARGARGTSKPPDIAADEWPGLHTEVKRGKKVNLWAALEQAVTEAHGSHRVPWVLARRDRDPMGWVVVVRVSDLIRFARMIADGVEIWRDR
jgi:hypothetical protein